tara:strand:- start:2344 stop:2646 length:303 start_codon:yes stop_codon:yes gene_type:complete
MKAYDEIIATYDKRAMEEIVRYGCQSGVCFKHIYYGDTIKFYEDHEDELMEYFTDNYETSFLVELFREAEAELTVYKNAVVWSYIELVCDEVLAESEVLV